jgi:urea transporter/murein DD-endopeptidase MepM/ murein hydrolase activator NlpD
MLISLLNAYSSLFYSYSRWLGAILLLASFLHPFSGFCGVLGWAVAVFWVWVLRYNATQVRSAVLTYNPLMTGLGLGALYNPSLQMVVAVLLIASLTFLFSLFLSAILHKYNFPVLSLPFLCTFWLVVPALLGMQHIQTTTFEIYYLNNLYALGGKDLVIWYEYINTKMLPLFITAFFQTLSVIFFQNNIFTGFLVALGLFIHSRLAFLYAIWGYAVAFVFYGFVGIDISQLLAFHAGFNFIIIASAIGTYYTTPSWSSLITATFAVLATILLAQGLQHIFLHLHSSAYSLPFVLTTLMFLWALRQRPVNQHPQLTLVQYFSPEKNFYRQSNNNERLKNLWYLPIDLPFFGEWIVSQGYAGKHTHLGEWSQAIDFVIVDEEMKQYTREGLRKDDYYAYNKPITSPAHGWVIGITNITEDNEVGEVNTTENWGNSILIQHAEGLYSQISHIKQFSFRVKVGDYIRKGEWIANCGSSGRSPVSHLHFQLQSVPYIGAKTLAYPLGYYILNRQGKQILQSFSIPKEGELVQNVAINPLLQEAFGFIPSPSPKGIFRVVLKAPNPKEESALPLSSPKEKESVSSSSKKGLKIAEWQYFTDAYNASYLYCTETKSVAYFVNDGTMFYFTSFEGDKNSSLFYFYLACYKVLQGFYEDVEIEDNFPLDLFVSPYNVLNDSLAPFLPLTQASYKLRYTKIDDTYHTRHITLESSVEIRFFKQLIKKYEFTIVLENGKMAQITIRVGKKEEMMYFD